MAIPVLPESAPFTPAQRAWLNGFFAGVLCLEGSSAPALAVAQPEAAAVAIEQAVPAVAEEFAWHDPTLPLAERQQLAEGRPRALRLMAAMAQLDCGTCGYLCHSYAEAINVGTERDLTRCTPGGRETARALKQIMAESAVTEIAA